MPASRRNQVPVVLTATLLTVVLAAIPALAATYRVGPEGPTRTPRPSPPSSTPATSSRWTATPPTRAT